MDMATALAGLGVTADSIDDSARERLDQLRKQKTELEAPGRS